MFGFFTKRKERAERREQQFQKAMIQGEWIRRTEVMLANQGCQTVPLSDRDQEITVAVYTACLHIIETAASKYLANSSRPNKKQLQTLSIALYIVSDALSQKTGEYVNSIYRMSLVSLVINHGDGTSAIELGSSAEDPIADVEEQMMTLIRQYERLLGSAATLSITTGIGQAALELIKANTSPESEFEKIALGLTALEGVIA